MCFHLWNDTYIIEVFGLQGKDWKRFQTKKIVRNYKMKMKKNGFWEKLHKYNYAFMKKLRKDKTFIGILPKIEPKNCQNARKTAGLMTKPDLTNEKNCGIIAPLKTNLTILVFVFVFNRKEVSNMFEKKIRLSDTDEVKDFVRAAGKCDFDIDVFYCRAVIDAKSLLGMLYLGIGKELTIKYGGNDLAFEQNIQKYAIC